MFLTFIRYALPLGPLYIQPKCANVRTSLRKPVVYIAITMMKGTGDYNAD